MSILDEIRERVKVDEETGCWVWQGYVTRAGYGQGYFSGRTASVHRLVFEAINGQVPRGMCVCHSCDVRTCCNPEHLWIGTQQQNIRDASEKRRMASCEKHHNAKLTEATVSEMVCRYASGESLRSLSREFGVAKGTVKRAVTGDGWKSPGRIVAELHDRPRGEKTHGSKFTESSVRKVRELVASGRSMNSVARQFGVTREAVRKIINRVTWNHVA